ncbi:MAG TPA: D-aminoacylase, partial [Gemmatimonadales bacterium]|nr:D-aminoacylase [Gemmatimonadales bacterium]
RALACLAAALLLPAPAAGQGERYDLLITGGTIVDGTGAPGFAGDIAVRGDRIVRLSRSPLPRGQGDRVIDATGLVVSPGFIDLHTHLEPIPEWPDAESHVRQGVTLAIGGPDGGGPWPFAAYLEALDRKPLGMNVGFLAGHNTIRRAVMGMAGRDPTPEELERMKAMVRQSMAEGAFGMSTGLFYLPGTFSKLPEVVELSKVAAAAGGIYTSHLRKEGIGLLDGVGEAMEIGRQAKIPVVLTHHKAIGRAMWGASAQTVAMMDSARAAGTDVIADQYPYAASHTGLGVLLPAWAQEGGDSAFARRVRDPVLRDSIIRGTVFNLENDRGGGDLRRVQFSRVAWDESLEGRRLYDWVVRQGLEPTLENAAGLVIEAELKGGAGAIYHVMDDADVERIMRYPWTAVASDGRLSRPGVGHPHPRAYGTFPRVLGVYVREKGVLALEEAVRKMTSLPAWRLGLADRGRLAEGMMADITLFDPATVKDQATFEQPHQYPVGIPFVIVNGIPVVDGGTFTDRRPGRVIRKPR